MAKSGAILREVGATNRTHPADYENAINENTALLLKVHTSNYKVVGFTAEVTLEQMVAIGKKHNLPVMEDLGSGALIDLSQYGLPKEPLVGERIAAGADVVTFSGDKILGGPQAGLMVGKKELIGRMNKNHLQRALRCGKLTLAALEATLRRYRQSPNIVEEIPTLRAFSRPVDEVRAMGCNPCYPNSKPPLAKTSTVAPRLDIANRQRRTADGRTAHGCHHRRAPKTSANAIAKQFRQANPPIIGRIKDDKFLLDLRTIFDAKISSQNSVPNNFEFQFIILNSPHALHHRHRRPYRSRQNQPDQSPYRHRHRPVKGRKRARHLHRFRLCPSRSAGWHFGGRC